MYKQHHNRVCKRFVLIFLSFGTIISFNCNIKSETVIMIREKKHTSKISASIRSPLINWYFERCRTSGIRNIRISDIFYWIFFQVMNATHAGYMDVLLYCEASYENWKCQLTIFVQNPMQTLLPDKWITCLLRFIGGTME